MSSQVPPRNKILQCDITFFYLEQQRLFTLTCWSLSELGGGRLWPAVEKLTSSTNGAAETLRLRKLVNDTTQTLYIPQTKKQEAFGPFVCAAGNNLQFKENDDLIGHQASLSFLLRDVRQLHIASWEMLFIHCGGSRNSSEAQVGTGFEVGGGGVTHFLCG